MPLSQYSCYNCFMEKQTPEGPCPYCGYDHAEHAAKYPMALRAGSILNGQYIVGRVLGQGGFGITYLAFDYQLKIKVAIKEYMPDGMATRLPETTLISVYSGEKQENFTYGAERFLDEARVLAKFLGNKNIAGVKSYFNENNTSYFVMDYIEGVSFKTYIRNQGGKIDYTDALRVLVPVLRALSVVHREGFIHRDVTPDNIYITKDGEIKLLDFGSARYSMGDKSKSLDVILKAGYAPKEQYMRRGKQGPYTDVYSVAACFYAAITGYLPPEALERMEEDELVAPSSRGVKLPAYLEDAILKGLEVKAEDRYQSAEEFLAVIEQGQLNEAGFAATIMQPVSPQQPSQAAVTGGTSQNIAAATQQSGILRPTNMPQTVQTPQMPLGQQTVVSGRSTLTSAGPVQQPAIPPQQLHAQANVAEAAADTKKENGLAKSPLKLVGIAAASVAGISLLAVLITALAHDPAESKKGALAATATAKPIAAASSGMPAVSDAPEISGANGGNALGNGNTTGNYANFGAAVSTDEFIYFTNQEDEGKLYRTKNPENPDEMEKVSDCSPVQLNYSGDWLYFIGDGKIYKMHTDGTDQTLLSDDKCEELVLSGDWLYYANISEGFNLYRISLDGLQRQRINTDWSSDINVLGDTVYYTDYSEHCICKINTDGSDKAIIYDAGECFMLNVLDDGIYFRNNSENGAICKIRLDGSEFTKLNVDDSSCLNVAGGWIYYRNNSDASSLYKIKTDGTQNSKLNTFDTNTICIAGHWLCYSNNTLDTVGWYHIQANAS